MKKILLILIFDIFIIYLYAILSKYWTHYGGVSSYLYKVEIPLILIGLNVLRPWHKKLNIYYFLPHFFFIFAYAVYDFYQHILKRIPIYSDLQEVDALYSVDPKSVIIGSILLIIISLILTFLFFKSISSKMNLFFKMGICFLVLTFFKSTLFESHVLKNAYKSRWDTNGRIRKNGRLTSIFQHHFEMNKNKKILLKSEKANLLNLSFIPEQPTNLYLIVMESYIDPRKIDLPAEIIKKINFSVDSISFNTYTSPAYGGATVKTEFELLTGHPSLGLINTLEFNVMKGAQISSWVTELKKNGYKLRLIHGAHSGFYNGLKAYQSMGFSLEDHEYLWEWEKYDYRKRSKRKQVYDGDLFDESLILIRDDLKNKKPFLTYIKGMYGHIPLERDLKKRPNIVNYPKVKRLEIIINQFIYRTKELKNFIRRINKIDPNSFILVVSDHLPSLHSLGGHKYKENIYTNIYISYYKTKEVDLELEKLYTLPIKLKKLINGKSSPQASEEKIKESYMKLLWESIQ